MEARRVTGRAPSNVNALVWPPHAPAGHFSGPAKVSGALSVRERKSVGSDCREERKEGKEKGREQALTKSVDQGLKGEASWEVGRCSHQRERPTSPQEPPGPPREALQERQRGRWSAWGRGGKGDGLEAARRTQQQADREREVDPVLLDKRLFRDGLGRHARRRVDRRRGAENEPT